MSTRSLLPRFVLPCALVCAAVSAPAQSGSGSLTGRVLDPTGAAVAQARVHLVEQSTQVVLDTTTTSTGDYTFRSLRPGLYTVAVSEAGFLTVQNRNQTVTTGELTRTDFALKPGSAATEVTVTADAPLLERESGALKTAIPNGEVEELPLNGRNVVNLLALAPGVSLPVGTQLPRINGGRPRTNEYLYDGISALQPEPGQVAFFPIIDDIQEFNIQSSGVSAEFGRFNGGVVNLSTKGGTDQLHGTVYEFLRNEDLNAKNYFTPAGTRKPTFRRNQYGASLGGPLLRQKLFAFADYQGTNNAVSVVRTSSVPTLAQRGLPDANGNPTVNPSGFGAKIYDPATTAATTNQRQEFAGDAVPIARIDPAALNVLKFYPLPTNALAANNYVRTGLDSDHQNQFDTRLDYTAGRRDRAFVRYTYFHDVENPVYPLLSGSGAITGSVANTGNVIGLSNTLGQQVVANEVHTFGTATLNEARFGYTRRALTRNGPTLGSTASSALGIPGIPTNASFNNALPVFAIATYTQVGPTNATYDLFDTSVTQLFDMVSHNIKAHSLKMGVDLRWEHLNAINPPNPTGNFNFSTLFTNQPANGTTASSGGNSLASFLLGQVNTFSIDLQSATLEPRAHIAEGFFQDDWRATSNLTFNLGLRYTLNFPSTEAHNQGGVFNLATQTYQYLGQNGFPTTARDLHYANLGPRFGVNYAVDAKTVIRSGYGLVWIEQTGITTPFTTPQFPFIQTVAQNTLDSIHPAFTLSGGPSVVAVAPTANAALGQGAFTVTRQLGSGYVQQWNLAVQRSLTNSLSFEVAYTGSVITRVGIPDTNLNQLTAAQLAMGLANPASLTGTVANPYLGQIPTSSSIGGAKVSNAQLLKPYPRFLTIARYRNNTGRTNYNAAEFKLQQRTTHGLDLLISYTHSKLMDDASSVFDSSILTGPTTAFQAADTFNPLLERDASTGDAPNTAVFSVVYRLPAGHGHSFASTGVMAAVLGGFEVNSIVTLQSGMPFAITDATNLNAFAGFGIQRPTISASANLPKALRTTTRFINTSAFAVTPQFKLGNASRDPARGPAYRDGDIALIRRVQLHEAKNLEIRAELFNLTNTPAFAQPNGSVGSAAFGSITATAADPRVLQVAAKLNF